MKPAIALTVALVALTLTGVPAWAAAQESPHTAPSPAAAPAQPGHAAAGGIEAEPHGAEAEAGEAEHGESPWATAARLFNFALLAGSLIYFLRSPFGAFLQSRKIQIRQSLAEAAATREEAAREVAAIDGKLKALPGELDALKRRGAEEIAAEEERIHLAAETERARMLENARHEIDRRALLAERRLLRRAAELAVAVATERVKRTITDADQHRLVDRYLQQVRADAAES